MGKKQEVDWKEIVLKFDDICQAWDTRTSNGKAGFIHDATLLGAIVRATVKKEDGE